MTQTLFAHTTLEVCEALGIGERVLKRLRDEGTLVSGRHFRYVGSGRKRPRLRWNLTATDEAITHRSRRLKLEPVGA